MPAARSALTFKQWAFVALMLTLTIVFVFLGNWQMHRLGEKEALVAAVEARLHQPAKPLPAPEQWAALDIGALNFVPLQATGTYRPDQTVRVFTSLENGSGNISGPGYWIMTPLKLAGGGSVFVNRGFVPEAVADQYANDPATPAGMVTIEGVARPSAGVSMFTPQANADDRIDWVRDPARMAAMVDKGLAPVAPFYLDLPVGADGTLPLGGRTVVEFPNNHFGYALTWYGFAIVAPVMLLFWLWRQRRPKGTAAI
ncbi:SURF1 family protein [Devosia rhodophyticola]|uniref:SURF1-like protein n=1 Tax=Devosia rhodophyticola TaxID=3026423 RepID=A0ABY7YZ78_9HYPH|nr:SURF1 family protein [Devosia rhodophyticola]WDR06556.1 SURF1 family protein [Devosia rhodophyticola]